MSPDLQNPFILWLLSAAVSPASCYAFVRKELRVRAIAYGAFLIACAVMIWPPFERDGEPGRIQLGLDLRGGIHLVLQVVIDDALNATVDDSRDPHPRPGRPGGHRVRLRRPGGAHLVQGRGRRAGPGEGHARRPPGPLRGLLGGPGARVTTASRWR